jgi:hypothetical protein
MRPCRSPQIVTGGEKGTDLFISAIAIHRRGGHQRNK